MTRASRLLLPLSALLGLGGAGCDSGQVHAFSAFHYDPARDCLDGAAVVDVVDGPDPGACAELRCWKTPTGEVFVTDAACDRPLDFEDHTDDVVGQCVRALWAYTRGTNGRCPAPVGDAGS